MTPIQTSSAPKTVESVPLASSKRKLDEDQFFNNSNVKWLGGSDKPPYTKASTYSGAVADRERFLRETNGLTALQKHCVYFDGDADGIIWPTDTFFGFYALGFGLILSLLAVGIIHGPFSYPTIPYTGARWTDYLPDPFFRIWIANIHRNKHGSDSESYNRKGELQRQRFDDIFDLYSTAPNKDGLSFNDLIVMITTQRNLMDPFGWFAMAFEWGSTYLLLWPSDGIVKKDDVHGIIDGSLFTSIAARRREGLGAFNARERKQI
ncbi:CALEOSIN-RELATED FAMILY PROTEIN-RELATED [Ceraceosorus bombacis]|uniref:CALEOSIN-RELATED FAMILY PROTEIN-RELATED n=1 Tax=Ceraceosorus bombacis TaxID=401625 RepID=A0A0P1BCQ6_9BASI|nr:CALEOSIN-RELATED FAMILY PROTEIN-RELATED [Ceraceosorus bombacis]